MGLTLNAMPRYLALSKLSKEMFDATQSILEQDGARDGRAQAGLSVASLLPTHALRGVVLVKRHAGPHRQPGPDRRGEDSARSNGHEAGDGPEEGLFQGHMGWGPPLVCEGAVSEPVEVQT